MRFTLAGTAAAAALLASPLATPPASAVGTLVVTCAMYYQWPVGVTSGDAHCTVTGVVGTTVIVNAAADMVFDTVIDCPMQTANGTLTTGGLSVDFNWTRIGSTGVWTTTGDIVGTGTVQFSMPCPTSGETAVFTLAGV